MRGGEEDDTGILQLVTKRIKGTKTETSTSVSSGVGWDVWE